MRREALICVTLRGRRPATGANANSRGGVLPAPPHADALGSRHWLIKYFRCYVVAGEAARFIARFYDLTTASRRGIFKSAASGWISSRRSRLLTTSAITK